MTIRPWSADHFATAWDFAARCHHGQSYGAPQEGLHIDFLYHLGRVSAETIWSFSFVNGIDEDLALQCAVLHDVLEDTSATSEKLLEHFYRQVVEGVIALTKNANLPVKGTQMDDSLSRILNQPREIWMVKMADRIANLQQPPYYWNNEQIESYRLEAVKIHSVLQNANPVQAARLWQMIEAYRLFEK